MNILFVDDEEGIREQAKIFLKEEDESFDVQTKASAETALRYFREKRSEVDVIITDYLMPQMNGIDLLKEVRKEDEDIPVIILTGRGKEEVVIEALNHGANRYLRKAQDPSTLYDLLKSAITQEYESWRTQKEFEENKRKIEELHKVVSKLLSCREEEKAYQIAVKAAEEILDYDHCRVAEVVDRKFKNVAKTFDFDSTEDDYELVKEGGIDKKTWVEEENFLIDDAEEEDIEDPLVKDHGFRSVISLPIDDIGIFQAFSEKPAYFDQEDLKMSELLISHLINAVNRMRSKKKLKEKEVLYRKIFETTRSAMSLLDEDLKISLANDTFRTLAEYYWEDIEGVNFLDLVVEDDEEIVKEHCDNIKGNPEKVPDRFDIRLMTGNREVVKVLMTVGYAEEVDRFVVSLMERS
ncbi:MAG: response regulator [Candidatus Thermoplasmatota archaeon]